jgi:hypothetical protein
MSRYSSIVTTTVGGDPVQHIDYDYYDATAYLSTLPSTEDWTWSGEDPWVDTMDSSHEEEEVRESTSTAVDVVGRIRVGDQEEEARHQGARQATPTNSGQSDENSPDHAHRRGRTTRQQPPSSHHPIIYHSFSLDPSSLFYSLTPFLHPNHWSRRPLHTIQFDFVPQESLYHFTHRILNNVPLQHKHEHACFCRDWGCPYHAY